MSNSDRRVLEILNKILKFNKEISTNQNKGLKIQKNIKNRKKKSSTSTSISTKSVSKIMNDATALTTTVYKIGATEGSHRASPGDEKDAVAIKNIEDYLINSSAKFLLQKQKIKKCSQTC